MSIISNEHQPGSPVAVDLDELCARGKAQDIVKAFPGLVDELRTLRARVGELESAQYSPTRWDSNGEAGDGQTVCTVCGEETEGHLPEECARVWKARFEHAEKHAFDDATELLQLKHDVDLESRAESAEARVKELEVVTFCRACNGAGGDGGQAPNGMWEFPCDACHGIGRVGPDLGTARLRITDLESQLAAARELEEQLRVFVAKNERRAGLLLEAWKTETDLDQCAIYDGRHAELTESLTGLRAILEVEAKGG